MLNQNLTFLSVLLKIKGNKKSVMGTKCSYIFKGKEWNQWEELTIRKTLMSSDLFPITVPHKKHTWIPSIGAHAEVWRPYIQKRKCSKWHLNVTCVHKDECHSKKPRQLLQDGKEIKMEYRYYMIYRREKFYQPYSLQTSPFVLSISSLFKWCLCTTENLNFSFLKWPISFSVSPLGV